MSVSPLGKLTARWQKKAKLKDGRLMPLILELSVSLRSFWVHRVQTTSDLATCIASNLQERARLASRAVHLDLLVLTVY